MPADELDMDDLAAGVQILVDDAIRKAAPGIARAAMAETESTAALLRASVDITKSQILAVISEGERHESWAKRDHAFGDQVAHRCGTWRCVARRGARAGDEPGPDSSVWLLVQAGIEAVAVSSINPRLCRLHITLSDGTIKAADVRIPAIKPRGTYDPEAGYAELDVVAREGGSFIAMQNAPGPVPRRRLDGADPVRRTGRSLGCRTRQAEALA